MFFRLGAMSAPGLLILCAARSNQSGWAGQHFPFRPVAGARLWALCPAGSHIPQAVFFQASNRGH